MALTAVLTGILLVWLSEAWAAYRAFRLGLAKGFLALLMPGYVLLLAKRYGYYQPFYFSWASGLALIVLGAMQIR